MSGPIQLTEGWLRNARPEQIAEAFEAGRLRDVLTGQQQPAPAPAPAQPSPVYPPPTAEQVAAWTAEAHWLTPPAAAEG